MEKKRRKREGTRRTTLAVLEILKRHTSQSEPISIAQIVKRLENFYEIHTHRDSVKAVLEDLMEYYPGPDQIRCARSARNPRYQYRYYYYVRVEEFGPLQENLQVLEKAIRKNQEYQGRECVLSFQFNGYGSDHRLHPTGSRLSGVLPLKILWAYGHPYLIGFFPNRSSLAHLRIDLMTDIQVQEQVRIPDERRAAQAVQVQRGDYLSSHLYMFYEEPGRRPVQIRLQIKKLPDKPEASLTFLQDAFGENWRSVSGTETQTGLEVWVRCLPSAMTQFVRQYMDRVRVLEPPEVKEQVESALRRDFQAYF